MKCIGFIAVLLLVGIFCVSAGSAASDAKDNISVTNLSLEPAVFMKGDTGTIGITLKNTGAATVQIGKSTMNGNGMLVISDETYSNLVNLGGGTSYTYNYGIRADAADGTYYPSIYLSFIPSGTLSRTIPIKVSDVPLSLSVINMPDTFQKGKEAEFALRIGNPRENSVSGVTLVAEGSSMTFSPTSVFVGELAADGSSDVNVTVTPTEEGELTFRVLYQNGLNDHETVCLLPVQFGTDRKNPVMVANAIEVMPEGDGIRISGDVTNAGLENAYSVVVTVAPPAKPMDPYRSYVVGNLEPDDFSGFELTVQTGDADEIDMIIQYRDVDGNAYETRAPVSVLEDQGISNVAPVSGNGLSPLMVAVLILLLIGVFWVISLSWRKKD